MTTFTKDDARAAKERCEKATPGPWDRSGPCTMDNSIHIGLRGPLGCSGIHIDDTADMQEVVADAWCEQAPDECQEGRDNAKFIAHARTDLPRALDALAEAWELLGYFSKKHYHTYHQDLNYEDREVFRCDECNELEGTAHEESCPIGKAEAIVRAAEEEQGG